MMRKTIFVIASLRGGGAEHVMSKLITFYIDNKHHALLITLDPPSEDQKYPIDRRAKHLNLSYKRKKTKILNLMSQLLQLWKLRRVLYSESPDTVLSFMTPTNILVILASLGLPCRTVVSERIHPAFHSYGMFIDLIRNIVYPFADSLVVQTKEISTWFSSRIPVAIKIIPNCVLIKCECRADTHSKTLVSVGRLAYQKGFDTLITAFSLINEKFPEWKLLIIGSGNQYHFLSNLIESFSLNSQVTLQPFTSNLCTYLTQASITIQPSRFEGFPNTILEAMSVGLCVIATREAGSMVIKDNFNGLLVSSNDPTQLALAMSKVMTSSKLRTQLGTNALIEAERYDCHDIFAKWLEILHPV